MKQVHKYVISVYGKYHSEYDNESDAHSAWNTTNNSALNVVFNDGTIERINSAKPINEYYKEGSVL